MGKWIGLCVLALASCNRDTLPGNGNDLSLSGNLDLSTVPGADLATSGADFALPPGTDLSVAPPGPDFGSGFCSGNTAAIQFNNLLAQSPSVDAHLTILNCCDAANIEWTSMQITAKVTLAWRHQVGQGPNPPVVLDLANLPMGWSVSMFSGCNPFVDQNCMPSDRYDSGLTGTLVIGGNFGQWTMSACVTADEGGNPHPVMHHVEVWTPDVTAM